MPNITTEIREIGPSEAAELLTKNIQNRKIVSAAVAKYVSDMQNDEWLFDGSPIRLSASGKLLDGQHRLTAVVQAEKTLRFLVITGLPEESQAVMDTGRKRTLANMLTINGEASANQMAAFLNLAYRWDNGIRGGRLFNSGNFTVATAHVLDPSIPVMLDYRAEHPEFDEVVREAQSLSRATGLFPSIAALTWWVLHNVEYDDAEEFLERLKDGAGLSNGSPILALRDRLNAIARDNRMRGQRTSHEHILAMVLKSWNAFREGKTIIRLYYKPGGANPEAFPEPI